MKLTNSLSVGVDLSSTNIYASIYKVTPNGKIDSCGNINVTGDISGTTVTTKNLYVFGDISGSGSMKLTSSLNVGTDLSASNIYANVYKVNSTGKIDSCGNINVTGDISGTTVTTKNMYVNGDISGTGNLRISGSVGVSSDVSAARFFATGDISGVTVTTRNLYVNGDICGNNIKVNSGGRIDVCGNINVTGDI